MYKGEKIVLKWKKLYKKQYFIKSSIKKGEKTLIFHFMRKSYFPSLNNANNIFIKLFSLYSVFHSLNIKKNLSFFGKLKK